MRKLTYLAVFSGLLFFNSCEKEPENPSNNHLDQNLERVLNEASQTGDASYFILPDSDDFSSIPQDPNNPITEAKVELGKMLYHETGLAVNPKHDFSKGTFSCASCHFAAAGFQANRVQGISDGGIGFGVNGEGRQAGPLYAENELDVQPLRTPTAMNGAYQKNMLWNGQFGATGVNVGTESQWTEGTPKAVNHLGYEGLEIQAIAGLGVHRLDADMLENTDIMLWYQTYFDRAFPDVPVEERYDVEHTGLAIAAYERTLLANQAPFQKWLRGNKTAMSDEEKRGALVFFEKANCATCHTGPALNSMEFHAIGMGDLDQCPEEIFATTPELGAHKGRGDFTGNAEDNYKFKVPQLYNLVDSPFFGHGSSQRTLRQIVEYKNRAVKENSRVPNDALSEDFVPQNLTDSEIDDLVAFLRFSLRDPNLLRYQPTSIVSGNCFPNNDPMSRVQLGCD